MTVPFRRPAKRNHFGLCSAQTDRLRPSVASSPPNNLEFGAIRPSMAIRVLCITVPAPV
jgi:hypothetical protein